MPRLLRPKQLPRKCRWLIVSEQLRPADTAFKAAVYAKPPERVELSTVALEGRRSAN